MLVLSPSILLALLLSSILQRSLLVAGLHPFPFLLALSRPPFYLQPQWCRLLVFLCISEKLFLSLLRLCFLESLSTFTSQSSVSFMTCSITWFGIDPGSPSATKLIPGGGGLDKICLHPSSSFPVGTLILNVIPSCINWIPLFSVSFLASSKTCRRLGSLPSACLANGIHLSFSLVVSASDEHNSFSSGCFS